MNCCTLGEVLLPPAPAPRNSAVALLGCAVAVVVLGLDRNNFVAIDRFRLLSLSQWLLILNSAIMLLVLVVLVASTLSFLGIFRHVKVDIVVLVGIIHSFSRAVRVPVRLDAVRVGKAEPFGLVGFACAHLGN